MSNAFAVYNEYLRNGYQPHQAAAMVGRFQQESGQSLNPTAVGDKSIPGASIGIGQWNRDRQAALKQFGGDNYTDPITQARFSMHELNTSEKRAGDMLRAAKTPQEAVNAAMGYERPQGFTWDNPSAGHGYSNTLNNTYALLKQPVPTNAVADPVTASQAQGLAAQQSAASVLPTVASTTGLPALAAANQATAVQASAPVAEAAADPMGGIFSLLMQASAQPQEAAPVAAAPQRKPQADNRTEEEKMAAVSQTPNVYLQRLRRRV